MGWKKQNKIKLLRLTKEVEVPLLLRLLEDVLLDRAGRDESIDVNLSRLPDTVRSVLNNRQHRRKAGINSRISTGRTGNV